MWGHHQLAGASGALVAPRLRRAALSRLAVVVGILMGFTGALALPAAAPRAAGKRESALSDRPSVTYTAANAPIAASAAAQLDHDSRAAARTATADLIWAAFLIDTSPFGLRPNWSTSP